MGDSPTEKIKKDAASTDKSTNDDAKKVVNLEDLDDDDRDIIDGLLKKRKNAQEISNKLDISVELLQEYINSKEPNIDDLDEDDRDIINSLLAKEKTIAG